MVTAALLTISMIAANPNPSRVYYFTASWCAPCKKNLKEFEPYLKNRGYKVGYTSDCDVQLIDVDDIKNKHLVQKFKIVEVPRLGDSKTGKKYTYSTKQDLLRMIIDMKK